jgi:hypothetical protein
MKRDQHAGDQDAECERQADQSDPAMQRGHSSAHQQCLHNQ